MSDAVVEREQITNARVGREAEARQREAMDGIIGKGVGRCKLEVGQIWEFVSQTTGEVGRYELESHGQLSIWQRLVRLRNVDTGGIACVYCDWLEKGESIAPKSHWRLVSA